MYYEAYYFVYLSGCAALILWLAWLLHRSGAIFLEDAFNGNVRLVCSVSQLLDVGFYLVGVGYVATTFRTYEFFRSYDQVAVVTIQKLGWFLLVLGPVHLFNLLLLALFRRKTTTRGLPSAI